jgi:hypothetical protein
MNIEFRIQHPLQRRFHQLLHQAVEVFYGPGLTGDLLGQYLPRDPSAKHPCSNLLGLAKTGKPPDLPFCQLTQDFRQGFNPGSRCPIIATPDPCCSPRPEI